jgi:alkaline phosphatase D
MGTSRGPSRRTLIKTGLATATTAALAFSTRGAAAAPTPRQNPFTLGVASGDPLPDGVLLWTRVTPTPEAVPGSGQGPGVDGRRSPGHGV